MGPAKESSSQRGVFGQKAVNIFRAWLEPRFGVKRVWMGWSWQLHFLAQTSPVLLTRRSSAAFRALGVLASRVAGGTRSLVPGGFGERGVSGGWSPVQTSQDGAPNLRVPLVLSFQRSSSGEGPWEAACERVPQPGQRGAGVPENTGSAGRGRGTADAASRPRWEPCLVPPGAARDPAPPVAPAFGCTPGSPKQHRGWG